MNLPDTKEPNKNSTHITQVELIQASIEELAKTVAGKFNNDEMDLVIQNLRQAKMWAGQYIETLKQL